MNEPQDGNYQRAWKTVLTDLKLHAPETLADLPYWQANKPGKHKADELYQYYVWAVYNAGLASRSLEATWDRIRAALRDFTIADIVAHKATVRADLRAVNRHEGKLDAVLEAAELLHKDPEIWRSMQHMDSAEAVAAIRKTFRYAGPQNTYHIVRNLGWDVPTHGGFTKGLADRLELDCDTLIDRLCAASGYRANTTDILLGVWSRLEIHPSGDEARGRFIALLGLPLGHAVTGAPMPPD